MSRLALTAVLAVGFASTAQAGQIVYAQGNFFLAKNSLSAVNYRSGTMIPLGAKVEVLKTSDDEVKCKVVDTGTEFEFVGHKSLGKSARDLFKGFFAEADPAPKLAALPADQQKAVRAGELTIGMSREAVLMAMGPPPPHKTASLEAPKWIYWQSKMAQLEVNFDGEGKVESFGPLGKPEKKPFLGGLFEKKETPKEYLYARGNLHHEEGTLSWVNYQVGPIIPVNTKIEIVDKGSSSVKFKIAGEDKTYVFENDKRSGKEVWPMFLEVFSPDDQDATFKKLVAGDQKMVKAAEVQPGMSREAVRMAWGPPPPHMTPSFESTTWTYWKTKMVKVAVTFKNDKVESIK
ncbi:MAG: hypothetical protein U0228_15425 [Myxococcaceae bacterium]